MKAISKILSIVLVLVILVLSTGLAITVSFYSTNQKTSTVSQNITIISNQTLIRPVTTTFTKIINGSFKPQKIIALVLVTVVAINAVCMVSNTNESSTIYEFPRNVTNQYFNATLSTSTSITTSTSYANVTVFSIVTTNNSTSTSRCVIPNGPSGTNSTSTCFCV